MDALGRILLGVQCTDQGFDGKQDKLAPGLLAAIVARANFERRQGQRSAACAAYADAIEREGAAKDGRGSSNYPFLVIQYAAFLLAAFEDVAAAREVYNSALASHSNKRRLWEVSWQAGSKCRYGRTSAAAACLLLPPAG